VHGSPAITDFAPYQVTASAEATSLILGIAVAWCQQLETALAQLLDARRHDTARPRLASAGSCFSREALTIGQFKLPTA
jgi:hypothetical protein